MDAADKAFARAGELNPRLDLTVVAQASKAADPLDADMPSRARAVQRRVVLGLEVHARETVPRLGRSACSS